MIHTKEPWPAYDKMPNRASAVEITMDDYARARVCVNACAGLTQDHFDGGFTVAGLSQYAKGLEKERDELGQKLMAADHENQVLREQRDGMLADVEEYKAAQADLGKWRNGYRSQIDAALRQRDDLLAALEWIASSLPQIGVERVWMLDCANKAIASVKVHSGPAAEMVAGQDDAKDAARWRAVKKRHGMALVHLATGSRSYSSSGAPLLLDAWADMADAEIKAFDPEKWINEEVPERLAELEGLQASAGDQKGGAE